MFDHEIDVSIRQLTPREASTISARLRPGSGWADDFPAEGDIASTRYIRSVPARSEPWAAPWLIVVDGVVAGTVGFKGEPSHGELEVGYGVVASRRDRGVATKALEQLLARLEGRNFVVRAETGTQNVASHRVLMRNGFHEVERRMDPVDGELIVWRLDARRPLA